MKVLCTLMSIFMFIGSFFSPSVSCQAKSDCSSSHFVAYTGEVKNIFIHSLIAYPEVLEQQHQSIIASYDKDCIDYIEFENMLYELYKNNYVLVDINDIFCFDENGNAIKKTVYVPKGKKPIVIGVDDVVYDPRKFGNGMVDKLCLDEQEKFYTETKICGKIDKSYTREFVPILEQFLQKYPDFSPKNARFCINLTGFCGILGYRITDKNETIRCLEVENAKRVVKRLKDLGYTFACHSYGHFHMKKISLQNLKIDMDLWKSHIEPIIGKTAVFVYPYGEWELTNGNQLSQKQKLLLEYGFKMFLGVGIYDFFSYMPLNKNVEEKVLFADRKNIDGYSLFNQKKNLATLFDCEKVISEFAKKRHTIQHE